ncbi:hypothetical protein C5Y96_00010 [Blastopirellula marina]|uniref:Uncharacterized protein n=1 Tax=Blastopirellula marina TaxID=124 RepID=A0A2S8GBI9_9BACT|nr:MULTISPECIES: hypothetical protein [Pirellulaceae]PQO41793.1 hypothetical protein C5Y96_00010 [Blastopirellula marina]RCS56345.1 hypothetical protein DTL36_00010 [Bremerella cremea]
MKSMTRTLWILSFAWLVAGCGSDPPSNSEWYIFIADGIDEPTRNEAAHGFQKLLGETASPGDVIHFIAAPSQQPVASLVVPVGGRNTRLRHSDVRSQLPKIKLLFDGSDATGNGQLGVPSVASTVNSLRSTHFSPRVILVGDVLYDDPHQQGWKMSGGYVPQDGSLNNPVCPFHAASDFPKNTTIAWLSPSESWGEGERHRSAVKRFYQLFAQAKGAQLSRITAGGDVAFKAYEHSITKLVAKDDGNQMEFVGQKTARTVRVPHQDLVKVKVDSSVVAAPDEPEIAPPGPELPPAMEEHLREVEGDLETITVAIDWFSEDPHCDMDVYGITRGHDEEISFRNMRTEYGNIKKDVRTPSWIQDDMAHMLHWEVLTVKNDRLSDLSVYLNCYQGTKPATVRVVCIWKGIRRQKIYRIEGPGDGAKDIDKRDLSPAWKKVVWDKSWERI